MKAFCVQNRLIWDSDYQNSVDLNLINMLIHISIFNIQYLDTAGSGQLETPPPRLVLEVGGTSTFQAVMPGKLKSPPLRTLKWGDFSFSGMGWLQSCSPSSSTSLGASRWPDPAVWSEGLKQTSRSSRCRYLLLICCDITSACLIPSPN